MKRSFPSDADHCRCFRRREGRCKEQSQCLRREVGGDVFQGFLAKWEDELEASVDCDDGVLRLYVECFVFCLGCKAERLLANLQI
jgi:hypothetical protein